MANKERLEDQVKHAQEELEQQSNYPGAVQETALEGANKHLLQFKQELEHIDRRTSGEFDQRKDVLGYPTAEHEDLCKSYAEAFGKMKFEGRTFEKMEFAREIAGTLFDDMNRQARDEHNFRPYGPTLPYPHSMEVLESYQETFTHALQGRYDDNPNTKLMYEAIREAHDYTLNYGLQEPQILSAEQFAEFTETSSQHQLTEMLKMVDHT